jgi:hypothetical protein
LAVEPQADQPEEENASGRLNAARSPCSSAVQVRRPDQGSEKGRISRVFGVLIQAGGIPK